MKRTISLIAVLVLLFCAAFSASAMNGNLVVDLADVLTDEQEAALLQKLQQGLPGIYAQVVFVGLPVLGGEIIREEQAVHSNLHGGLRIIEDDPGKEAVILPEADSLSPHAFPVDHA